MGLTALLLALPLTVQEVRGQDPIAACAAEAGGPGKADLLLFDQELRAALGAQDAAALALLVEFPLRVSSSDGATISVDNPSALQVRFGEVFTPRVRKAVLDQEVDELFCKYTGVMYGSGEVWVHVVGGIGAMRYAVAAVNVPGKAKAGDPPSWHLRTPRVTFTCNADQERLIIDVDSAGVLRYRAWKKPHSIRDKPDVEVVSGTETLEGTDPCTHAIWTFRRGNREFVVSELGCTEEDVPRARRAPLRCSPMERSRHRHCVTSGAVGRPSWPAA